MADPYEMIKSEALQGAPHGFLTGIGKSGPPDPARLVPNAQLILLKQVHSPTAIVVDASCDPASRPEADALITATPGLVLGIVTADCAPVLFFDPDARVVAAAHAGWRGAHFGILEATVRRMEEQGANRNAIRAVIGPSIAQENYEVGWDFVEQFEERHQRFFVRSRPGKWQFDLPAYVAWRLQSFSLAHIGDVRIDTYAEEARFHSFRRATHRGEKTDGRQYSLIALAE